MAPAEALTTGMEPVPAPLPDHRQPTSIAHHAYGLAAFHGDAILREVPKTLRRVALLFLVLAVSIPVFLGGLLIVLWHMAG